MNDVYDRTRMFAAVPHDVIDRLKNANALALYTILKRYAGANGKAHPGRKKLAEDMGGVSVRTVDRVVEDLRRAGLVETFSRFKDDDGNVSYAKDAKHRNQTSNGYIILDPLVTGVAPPSHERHHPLVTGVAPRGTPETHEVDTPEVDTSEVDPPVGPQGTAAKKPRRRITEDWAPRPEVVQQLVDECPGIDQEHELAQMRDHFLAKGTTSTDWNLNYRGWIRREAKWARERGTSRGSRGAGRKADQIIQAVVGLDQDRQEGRELAW